MLKIIKAENVWRSNRLVLSKLMFGDLWEDIHQYQGTWSRWLYLLLRCILISAEEATKNINTIKIISLCRCWKSFKAENVWRSNRLVLSKLMFGDLWEDISHQYQGTWSRWLYLLLRCILISARRSYKNINTIKIISLCRCWKPLKLRMFEDQQVNNTIKTDVWRSLRWH